MRTILILLISLLGGHDITDIHLARNLFLHSYDSKEQAIRFYDQFHEANVSGPLLNAYKGVSEIMMCPHYWNPYTKYRSFTTGRDLLDEAISKQPGNIEIHYLRYVIQKNAPAILGYKHHLDDDRKLLEGYLVTPDSKDAELIGMIKDALR